MGSYLNTCSKDLNKNTKERFKSLKMSMDLRNSNSLKSLSYLHSKRVVIYLNRMESTRTLPKTSLLISKKNSDKLSRKNIRQIFTSFINTQFLQDLSIPCLTRMTLSLPILMMFSWEVKKSSLEPKESTIQKSLKKELL